MGDKGNAGLSSKHTYTPQMFTEYLTPGLPQQAGKDLVWSLREEWARDMDLETTGT